jgi:hypothetical protein
MTKPTFASVISERELQTAVIECAKLLGWRVMHQRPARTLQGWRTPLEGHAGYPDLTMLRPPRLVFAELKSKKGRVHFDQATWLNGFDAVPGVEQYLWRPADWETGKIEDVLR